VINIIVSIKFGELDEVMDWCEQNCQDVWNIETIIEYSGYQPGTYEFVFTSDSDATFFALRWS
jgi:hypothetical protein